MCHLADVLDRVDDLIKIPHVLLIKKTMAPIHTAFIAKPDLQFVPLVLVTFMKFDGETSAI
jgi:hypothetical protein